MTTAQVLVSLGGLAAIAWVNWFFFVARAGPHAAVVGTGGVQEVAIAVAGGYEPSTIRVRAGRPVRLVFTRTDTNSCTEEVVVGAFSIRRFLPVGSPVAVEFTPSHPGEYDFSCGMGMVHGRLIVEP